MRSGRSIAFSGHCTPVSNFQAGTLNKPLEIFTASSVKHISNFKQPLLESERCQLFYNEATIVVIYIGIAENFRAFPSLIHSA
jgi:hypothetical protein